MAAHIAVGEAAEPPLALPCAHRQLASPPAYASRLWMSGIVVVRPCARCATSRGTCTYFRHLLTLVAGSVDATRACTVMVRARRRAGGAVIAGPRASCGLPAVASLVHEPPWWRSRVSGRCAPVVCVMTMFHE